LRVIVDVKPKHSKQKFSFGCSLLTYRHTTWGLIITQFSTVFKEIIIQQKCWTTLWSHFSERSFSKRTLYFICKG